MAEVNKIPREQQDERSFYCLLSVLNNPERKLCFTVESNLSFEVEAVQFSDRITLKPYPQPPQKLFGRSTDDKETQEMWEQFRTGRYLITGEYASFNDSRDLGPQMLEVISEIDHMLAVLGFVTGAKMHWYPTYTTFNAISKGIKPTPAVAKAVVLKQEQVDQAKIIWGILNSMPQDDRNTLISAIDWHWQGHNSPSVLNSFESFWKAIEALSIAWTHKLESLKDDSATSSLLWAEAKKTRYKYYLNCTTNEVHLPRNTIPPFVRWATGLMYPTARLNISTAFNHCFSEKEAINSLGVLFDGHPSRKNLRDDIAHGKITEADHGKKSLISRKIPELQSVSRKFIVASSNKRLR